MREEELPLVVLSSLLASGLTLEQTWSNGSCRQHGWYWCEGQKAAGQCFLGAEKVKGFISIWEESGALLKVRLEEFISCADEIVRYQ